MFRDTRERLRPGSDTRTSASGTLRVGRTFPVSRRPIRHPGRSWNRGVFWIVNGPCPFRGWWGENGGVKTLCCVGTYWLSLTGTGLADTRGRRRNNSRRGHDTFTDRAAGGVRNAIALDNRTVDVISPGWGPGSKYTASGTRFEFTNGEASYIVFGLVGRVGKTRAQPTRKLRREKPSVNTNVWEQVRGMRGRIMTKIMRIMYASHLAEIAIVEVMASESSCPMRAGRCSAQELKSILSTSQVGHPHSRREPHAMPSGSLRSPRRVSYQRE